MDAIINIFRGSTLTGAIAPKLLSVLVPEAQWKIKYSTIMETVFLLLLYLSLVKSTAVTRMKLRKPTSTTSSRPRSPSSSRSSSTSSWWPCSLRPSTTKPIWKWCVCSVIKTRPEIVSRHVQLSVTHLIFVGDANSLLQSLACNDSSIPYKDLFPMNNQTLEVDIYKGVSNLTD